MAVFDNNALTWTTAELLTDIRQKARIPSGTLNYADADLLEEATQQLWGFAGWAMSQASDGRMLSTIARPSASNFSTPYAPGRELYLPWDAVGDTFDSVFWKSDARNVEKRLELVELATQPLVDTPASQGEPWGYSIVDGRLRLYPKPNDAGVVRINYQRRLPRLVASTSGRPVSASSYTSTYAEITYTGTQLFTATGETFDIFNAAYPHRNLMPNAVISGGTLASNIVQTTTYTESTWSGAFTGNTIVQSGYCPYVQLPLEFKACFTNKIASEVLSDIGDQVGAQAKLQDAERELARVMDMLSPRSQTSRVKVVNQFSLMRTRRRGGVW